MPPCGSFYGCASVSRGPRGRPWVPAAWRRRRRSTWSTGRCSTDRSGAPGSARQAHGQRLDTAGSPAGRPTGAADLRSGQGRPSPGPFRPAIPAAAPLSAFPAARRALDVTRQRRLAAVSGPTRPARRPSTARGRPQRPLHRPRSALDTCLQVARSAPGGPNRQPDQPRSALRAGLPWPDTPAIGRSAIITWPIRGRCSFQHAITPSILSPTHPTSRCAAAPAVTR